MKNANPDGKQKSLVFAPYLIQKAIPPASAGIAVKSLQIVVNL